VTRRRSGGGGGGGGFLGSARTHSQIIAPAIGGFAVGQLESSGILDKLPEVPLIGKKGTALLALHLLRPQATGIIRDVKLALGVLCGYELAKNGTISGGPFAGGPFGY
jgi:hypothetical protein